eukprot:m51a1_g13940 hypothetical protein (88) ;mRNA; f:880545-880808
MFSTGSFALWAKTPEEGAQTELQCLLAPLTELEPGGYHNNCEPWARSRHAFNRDLAQKLWDASEAQLLSPASQLEPLEAQPQQSKQQ